MSTEARNFATYQLDDSIYELADGVLPSMAEGLGYDLGDTPSTETIGGLTKHIGPAKWLQDNVALVQERLGNESDAVNIAADWVEQSGILQPTNRSFKNPDLVTPKEVDVAFITGGVARWMLRRTGRLLTHVTQGNEVGMVYLPVGNREMREGEHHLVTKLANYLGRLPVEYEFAESYLEPMIRGFGLKTAFLYMEDDKGSEVMRQFVNGSRVMHGTTLAVGNAGSVIQSAGEFRAQAAAEDPWYDVDGNQLFMISDSIELARNGESLSTHQNPLAALGQVSRSAYYLAKNQPKSEA